MPFRSQSQVRAMFAKDPALAKRWVKKYGLKYDDLPDHVKRGKQHSKGRHRSHKD